MRQQHSQHSSSPPADFPIQLSLTRCPDGVMYALAETACLSQWKDTQLKNGCLSYRELVRKAGEIESEMKARCGWAVSQTTGGEVTLGVGMGLGMYFPDQLSQQSHHSSLYSHSQQQQTLPAQSSSHSTSQSHLRQHQRHRISQQNHYQNHHPGLSTPSSQPQQFDLSMGSSLSALGLGLAPLSMSLGMGHGVNNFVGGSASSTTYPTPSPTLHSSMDLSGGMSVTTPISPTSTSEQTMLTSNVFYEAALVYLWSTVSGHFPGESFSRTLFFLRITKILSPPLTLAIPEIADSTQSLVHTLHKLDRLDTLPDQSGRELLFPICLAGCLSDTREHRDFFRNCVSEVLGLTHVQGLQLGGIGGPADAIKLESGNSPQQRRQHLEGNVNIDKAMKGRSKVIDLIEEVWRRRDEGSQTQEPGTNGVDWRKVREEISGHLLVI